VKTRDYFAKLLSENRIFGLNDVVFNQILVKCATPELTSATLKKHSAEREMLLRRRRLEK
jgi:hypothetical protein